MSEITPSERPTVTRPIVALQQRGPHPLAAFLAIAADVCTGNRSRLAAVLAGVRAYQSHLYVRTLRPPKAVAQVGATRLLDYGGSGRPVVFVPSLINPPTVLDLAEGNSLLRWLARRGVRPLLVDWGTPGPRERRLSVGGYVRERLVPLVETLGERPALAGYCLGGTMALAAAAIEPPRKLALIATPWRFAGYDDGRRAALTEYWTGLSQSAETLGSLPMSVIQPMFWHLDPQAAVGKFEKFGRLDPDSPDARSFVALEDWANDGPPLSLPVARELFEDFYRRDLTGSGGWLEVTPEALAMPILNLVSTRDRIVPAEAAPSAGRHIDVDAGHVGMIVGSKARPLVWEPLRDFLLD